MEVQDYRAAGYPLSQYIDQKVVALAESEVAAAYLVPIVGEDYDAEEEPYRSAIMCLTFMLISIRTAQATRAGGKVKNVPQSTTPSADEIRAQYSHTAHSYLSKIDGYDSNSVSDLCMIYFKSNYFYTI